MAHVFRATSTLRAAGLRTAVRTSAAPAIFRRGFVASSINADEKHINVVSYKDGERAQETLAVPAASEPVVPPGQDIEVAAQPLKPELHSQMSPTMQKFTLFGKTAVITG